MYHFQEGKSRFGKENLGFKMTFRVLGNNERLLPTGVDIFYPVVGKHIGHLLSRNEEAFSARFDFLSFVYLE